MPIKDELKEILVCPKCKGELEFEENEILCLNCKLAYLIKDDIPVMLIDEARKIEG